MHGYGEYEVVLYWSEEDEVYIAKVPQLPGCMAHGDDHDAALRNVNDAIQFWIERARELGREVPQPKGKRSMPARMLGHIYQGKPKSATMKLRFDPNLDFQQQAVEAVCGLFHGQEVCRTEFTVTRERMDCQESRIFEQNNLGVGNRLTLPDEEVLANLNDIQLRNGLPPSASLDSGNFTVEMETGTGKTYVYLRTIFELNKRYGFTKFIIVVPSVAIKEGVYKSLQTTDDHFRALYSGAPCEYFLYDSAKLGQVRNFATSSHIHIMVMTVGAINRKEVNNLYKGSERTGGERPIDLIKATRPVLIVDEPQSVDGGLGGRGKEALDAMNPLCTLRYSATHVDEHHMVYRLDAVDAYERKLVKQIEVASATVEDAYNKPYVRLISTSKRGRVIGAKVELDVEVGGQMRRMVRTVRDGCDLEQETGRAVYHGCSIGEIGVGRENVWAEIRMPGGECFLGKGEAWGDVDVATVQRQMIRRTILEHLDKEKRLLPQGIKVLSLFFVDAVERYRSYDEAGNAIKGDYARIFEQEYQRFARHPKYQSLFRGLDIKAVIEKIHDGYFSVDRKGGWTNTADGNQANRENAERAYSLIMKDKEKLLSIEEPLRFIFSHSALREGWDNPNVFQICALRDIQTERERRQTVGRGLRLCVNQDGERLRGFDLNTLTVIARESYEEFAENLQREIEEETGIRFGVIEPHQFAKIQTTSEGGISKALGFGKSKILCDYLQTEGYIDAEGRMQMSLHEAIKDGNLALPDQFADLQAEIERVLRRRAGCPDIKNADERHIVRPRQAVLDGAEFKALWDRIKHKTTYRVAFDNDALLKNSVVQLKDAEPIPRTRLQWRKADIAIGQAGVEVAEIVGSGIAVLEDTDVELPDLLTELQHRTQLTRRSIYKILVGSGRLCDFKLNPQQFIVIAARAINWCKRQALVDGIKYQRIGDAVFYAQELFEHQEIAGYLKNMCMSEKSIYDRVIYESDVEARFADDLERNSAVKLYAKLPGWFTVPTPLGSYNPDWAVLIDTDEGERIYFVVETKGSTFPGDLRNDEVDKIACGKAHFQALQVLENPVRYEVAARLDQLIA